MDVHEPGFEPNGAGFAIPPEYARLFKFRGFFFYITQWTIAQTTVVLVFWFLSMSSGFDL